MSSHNSVHVHICLVCGKEWECGLGCGVESGSISECTCAACAERMVGSLAQYAGIHMHSCPKCGRGWDCKNGGCGAIDGSLSKVICGLCMEHVVAIGGQQSATSALVSPSVIERMPHMHVCVINDHIWEHLDADCGFATMMEPEKMRCLECPECFGSTK